MSCQQFLSNGESISDSPDFDLLLQDLEHIRVLGSLVQLSQLDKEQIMVSQDYFEPLFKHDGSKRAKTGEGTVITVDDRYSKLHGIDYIGKRLK